MKLCRQNVLGATCSRSWAYKIDIGLALRFFPCLRTRRRGLARRSFPVRGTVVMERRAIIVRGIVQGVGFRPFVYNLAERLGLNGFVRNQTGTLLIEVEGEPPELDRFLTELADRPPPLSQINH